MAHYEKWQFVTAFDIDIGIAVKTGLKRFANKAKSERGSLPIYIFIVLLILLFMAGITAEYLRANAIHDHIDYELSKAVGVAIQTAVYDSQRVDKGNQLDTELALETFYSYLRNEMQLDDNLRRYINGNLEYTVEIDSVIFDKEASRGNLKGTVLVPPTLLKQFVESQIQIPFEIITPRNVRKD